MISRHLRLLPPHILLTINQQLDPLVLRQRYSRSLLWFEPRRANVTSILSRVGITTREEKFKTSLERVIEQARQPEKWASFPEMYNGLLSNFRGIGKPENSLPFLSQALGQLMLNLTTSRTPNRAVARFVNAIFEDIKRGHWKIPLAPDHYLAIVRSCAQSENFQEAEAYLQECLQTFPFSSIPPRLFVAIIGEYRRYNDFESAWRIYESLKSPGRVLDRYVYYLVQDVLMGSPVSFIQEHILELQRDFEHARLGQVSNLALLLETFQALQQADDAKKAAAKLHKLLKAAVAVRYAELRAWETLIKHTFTTGGVIAAQEMVTTAQSHGYIPSPSLLHRIVAENKIVSPLQLKQCEQIFSLTADTITWSLLIHQALAVEGVEVALSIYKQAKQDGIIPAAYMVHPLIRALCGGHLRKELKWKNIEEAMALYRDLTAATEDMAASGTAASRNDADGLTARLPPPSTPAPQIADGGGGSSSKVRWSSPARIWPGPDSMIYDTLLRGIAQLARTMDPTTPLRELSRKSQATLIPVATSSEHHNLSNAEGVNVYAETTLWELALKLLEDMRRLNVPSSPMSITAIIVLLMRISPTFHDAFQIYRSLSNGERLRGSRSMSDSLDELVNWGESQYFNQFTLDASSYENLIRGFCTLKPKRENGILVYPPADLYLEMVKDMQLAGHLITEDVYMTFLYRLGRQARSLRLWEKDAYPYSTENDEIEGGSDLEDLDLNTVDPNTFLSTRQSILHGIRTIHNHIVLNAGITPSVDLLNAMLDAYNKVAAVHDAFKVWDTIFLSRIYNTQSISIILDTCGWAKVPHKAAQIWNYLVVQDFPFVKNNWDSRVECLCRLGKLDDAIKVVCLEMPAQNKLNASRREQERMERGPQLTDSGKAMSKIASRALLDQEEKDLNIMPDTKTLAVLFSFATKSNQVEEVRNRVKRYLPDVWETVPGNVKGLWLSSDDEPR